MMAGEPLCPRCFSLLGVAQSQCETMGWCVLQVGVQEMWESTLIDE